MPFVLDVQPLNNALRWYVEATEKEFPVAVNKKMKDVVIKTFQNSPFVTRAAISAELQEYYATKAYVTTGKRAGQRLAHPKALLRPWPLARAIIAKRLLKKGVSPRSISGGEFEKLVEAMIKGRLSSGSFEKSGWIPALRMFGASAGGVSQWTVQGSGLLATIESAVAEIRNDVVAPWAADSTGYRKAFNALQDAFNEVAPDTLEYADELLMKAWQDVDKHLRG